MTINELIQFLMEYQDAGEGSAKVVIQWSEDFEIELEKFLDGEGKETLVYINFSSNELKESGREVDLIS